MSHDADGTAEADGNVSLVLAVDDAPILMLCIGLLTKVVEALQGLCLSYLVVDVVGTNGLAEGNEVRMMNAAVLKGSVFDDYIRCHFASPLAQTSAELLIAILVAPVNFPIVEACTLAFAKATFPESFFLFGCPA